MVAVSLKKKNSRGIRLGPGPGAAGGTAVTVSDDEVELAIQRAVEFLWSAQQADGQWQDPRFDQLYPGGLTALAAFSLRTAGTRISDPRLHKAVVYLLEHEDEIQTVYARAFRLMLWVALDPRKYRTPLRADVRFLSGQHNRQGAWGYGLGGRGRVPRGWSRRTTKLPPSTIVVTGTPWASSGGA